MRSKSSLRWSHGLLLLLALVPLAWGYDLIRKSGGPVTWDPGTVTVRLQLGSPAAGAFLADGSASYDASVQVAMQTWNSQINSVQFAPQVGTTGGPVDHDGINQIGFDSTIYGDAFDDNTLAVTLSYSLVSPRGDGTYKRTQSDIIFNTKWTWDSYRGNLRVPEDIRRVALHELGHMLGLNHPDQADPVQNVTAIMNSSESNVDALTADDITGAQFLYGAPGGGSTAPAIAGQPTSQTVNAGNAATFNASALGNPSPTLLWQRLPVGSGTWANLSNGGNYSGVATATLTVSNTTAGMTGDQFRCVATNASGSATSNAATLTVNTPPAITGQPSTQSVTGGSNVVFSVAASGAGPLSYQWKRDNVNLVNTDNGRISGANAATLSVLNVQANEAGVYTVVVSNPVGFVTSAPATLTVISKPGIISAAAGSEFSLFIRSDGTLWGAGLNLFGALGDGTSGTSRRSPILMATGVVAVSAGASHSLFVKSDGTLWATGSNGAGQLGDGTLVNRLSPVQIATNVVAAAAGGNHSLFIKADGTLWAMGNNGNGELGDGTTTVHTSPVKVANDVSAVACGYAHSMFIKFDGSLWTMGANSDGQLGDGTPTNRSVPQKVATGVATVAAGYGHSLFVKSDGTLWGMGDNFLGELGVAGQADQTTPVQLATGVASATAGKDFSLFVKTDRSLWGMGNATGLGFDSITHTSPVQITTGISAAAAGWGHSLIIKPDGSLWATGSSTYGSFADGTLLNYSWTFIPSVSGTLLTPAMPAGIFASDGTALNMVRVSWSPAVGAASYEVWRSTTNSLGTATRVASNLPSAIFYDLTAIPGVTYYYWVKAVNQAGAIFSSAPDAGIVSSRAGDFNGDGKADLLWQNTGTGQRSLWLMNGLTATGGVDLGTVPMEWVIAGTGDFTGDGKTDLLWQNTVTGQRSIWAMNGTTAMYGVDLGTVSLDWWIAGVGDFNADGKPDILWTNTVTNERAIWLMNGTTKLSNVSLGVIPFEWSIAGAADFNLDGKTDILWSNVLTGERSIWLMNGTTSISGISLGIFTPRLQISGTGDYNGDGSIDILLSDQVSGARSVWLMNGTTIASTVSLATVSPDWILNRPVPRRVPVDFNADGKSDIVWQNMVTGERSAWLMNGTTALSGISLGSRSTDWEIVATGDFNFDGRADLVWQNNVTGECNIWLMNGGTKLSEVALPTLPLAWKFRATGDFNVDGAVDLVLQNTTTGECAVWFMNGTTPTGGASLGIQPLTMQLVGCGDFNADSKADLVWTNTTTGERSIWLMNGTTMASSVSLGVIPLQWEIVGTGDFDQDGNADLVWQNSATGERSIWLMNGTSPRSGVSLGTAPTSWSIRN